MTFTFSRCNKVIKEMMKQIVMLATVLFVVQQRHWLSPGVVGLIVTYTQRVREHKRLDTVMN